MTGKKSVVGRIADYSISFVVYSIIIWIINGISGWLVYPEGGFDGGMLFGPYSPFYGFLIMTVMLVFGMIRKFGKKRGINPTAILLILISLVLFLTLEHFGSVLIEFLTGTKPWDYSGNIFNINGRICWENAIFLTVFELICVYVAQPFINRNSDRIRVSVRTVIAFVMIGAVITDVIFTFLK